MQQMRDNKYVESKLPNFDPAKSHIPSLDGVRALAILSVIVVHAFYRGPDSGITGSWQQVVILGWSGVDLFFVLSGFLITSILVDAKGSPNFFRDFYVKRFGRIFPLYYAILIAFLFLALLNISIIQPMVDNYVGHWWAYFLFICNFSELFGWNLNNPMGPAWSLAVEEQYYLIWPALIFFFSPRTMKIVAPALLIGGFFLRFALLDKLGPLAMYHSTMTHADGIITGSIIALYRDEIAARHRLVWVIAPVLAATLMGVFFAAGTTHYENGVVVRYGYLPLALFYGAFLVMAISVRPLARALSIAPLRTIGKYSYCIYLIHWPMLIVADHMPWPSGFVPWVIFVVVFTALCTGIAALSWIVLEKPAASLIRRVGLRKKQLADEAGTANVLGPQPNAPARS